MHTIIPTVKIKTINGIPHQCILINGRQVFIPETQTPREFLLDFEGEHIKINQNPVQHYTVHVICTSHHDLGYTDLSSEVIKKYTQALRQAVDDAYADSDYRISIESFWSLEEYMGASDESYRDKMAELLKSGRFEVNASYGNMITEVMGHSELYRSVRPALDFAEKHGFPVITASHNDIPGFTWGFCRALCDHGIKMLVMGFPEYNNWGEAKLPCQWDFKQTLGYALPGGVIWESPDGKKLLMWITDQQYGPFPSLKNLDSYLAHLTDSGYPYDVLRYPVIGASQDNSPYHSGYADSVRKWNAEWDYPRLIMSTNRDFYLDFEKYIPSLKVIKGDVPGCDYPAGHLSLPDTAALNAYNRSQMLSAQTLAFITRTLTEKIPDNDLFRRAQRAILHYDEHCTAFHFPCGPTADAAKYEKKLYAYRAASYIYEASQKAMAEVADRLTAKEGITLCVFNPTAQFMTAPVEKLMREFDNGGQYLRWMDEGYYKIAQIADRFHYNPQNGYLEGKFDLYGPNDEKIPFVLDEIGVDDPELYAAGRKGAGSGSRRYGFFEDPSGIKQTLRFVACDLPPFGYKAYRLVLSEKENDKTTTDSGHFIENEYFRITTRNGVLFIYDKQTGCDLLDHERHGFGEVLTRDEAYNVRKSGWKFEKRKISGVRECIYFSSAAPGHPHIVMRISLTCGIRRFDADFKIIKDDTPLLTTAIAFPFKAENAEFTFDAPLCAAKPAVHVLHGAYSDIACLYGWVRQDDISTGRSVICSSPDSAVFSLSEFRDIYISTAHRCYMDHEKAVHQPQQPGEFQKGNFFSVIDCGNFGTNFALSDPAVWVMRYSFTTASVNDGIQICERFAESVKNAPQAILKHPERSGSLPDLDSAMTISGELSVLNICMEKNGTEISLWNRMGEEKTAAIAVKEKTVKITVPPDTVKTTFIHS